MHAYLTRALQHRRGHRRSTMAPILFQLAVCMIITFAALLFTHNALASSTIEDVINNAVPKVHRGIKDEAPYEIEINRSRSGQEGVELAARLREKGGLIRLPIKWRIFRDTNLSTSDLGKPLLEREEPLLGFELKPGRYIIEAHYGLLTTRHALTLKPQQYVNLTLILNVGGIRPLSRVSNSGPAIDIPAHHKIIRIDGIEAGKLMQTEINQGEIIRLGAGKYRVISEFIPGNTVAEQTVSVKPGMLTSLEMSHKAALVTIIIPGDNNTAAKWTITQNRQDWSANGFGHQGRLVLAPGEYTITAQIGDQTMRRQIEVKANENIRVSLN